MAFVNLLRTGVLLAALAGLFMAVGWLLGGTGGMLIALAVAAATNLFAFWNADSMVLRMYGAREIDARSAPDLYGLVQQLAQRADLPMPRVYLIDTAQPNAFATGRNPDNAAVAVTRGLLNMMSREELAGVMAHELAHVRNRDTLIMTVTATIAGAIGMLASFALFFGGNRDNPAGLIGTIALMVLAPLAASLVQMAISRAREYDADRAGAEICGDPRWLASALAKLERGASAVDNHMAENNPATAHLFIVNPLHTHAVDGLFRTHPRTEDRIARLMAMVGNVVGETRPAPTPGRPGATSVPSSPAPPDGAVAMSQAPTGGGGRVAALSLLQQVLRGRRPLDEVWQEALNRDLAKLEPRDRAFARLLVATVLRRLGQIDGCLAACLKKPLPQLAPIAHDALRLGAAQLLFLGTKPHAAVDRTVRLLQRQGALAGLANAVLRRLAREGDALLAKRDETRDNLPKWLWQSWVAAYGEPTTRAIVAQMLREPPLDLSLAGDAREWIEPLQAEALPTGGLRRTAGGQVAELPGYDAGAWWVQDAAATLPARLLGDVAGKRVLDLCCAPGGKTAQLVAAGAQVTAVDISTQRQTLTAANLKRLRLDAEVVTADITEWRPAQPFDLVLLDAPCTATGTLRRHPDVIHLKRASDVAKQAELQSSLLDAAAAMLAPSGRLVYAVCSLQPEEGAPQVDSLIARHPGWRREPVAADELPDLAEALTEAGDVRVLPSHWADRGGLDGFYIARLTR